ncbi:hypothetical protein ABZ851_30590 [Streptomyces sp. NPDC047049]|uniref:hypothetical protein n=1 Tax=Streptomyces sp. NPDC047049 TaxID=3156688 RepID=UPI0033E7F288
MTTRDPVWVHYVLVCESAGTDHEHCTDWRYAGEHRGTEGEQSYADARAHPHARVMRHPEHYPLHRTVAFEHRTGGGPCAACGTARGPCTDTPTGPLFLCETCLTLLENELRRSLTHFGLPDPGPQPQAITGP